MTIARIVVCLLAVPCAAVAQDGRIAGTVTDATGGVLPGVTITAAAPARAGGPVVRVTDGTGQYAFAALPPGEYTLTFTLTPDGWRSTGRHSSRRPPPGQRAGGLQLVHLRVQ